MVRRRRLVHLVAAGLVVWAAGAVARAVVEHGRRPPGNSPWAAQWHQAPASPRVRRLARFLRAVDAALEPGSRLVVAVPVSSTGAGAPPDAADAMFRYLWIAYLLPRQDVVPPWAASAASAAAPRYWASFQGAGATPAGAVEIARWENGALYRLAPAVPAAQPR